ncbi:hypothetical protein [Metabacillus litoralis]|uniref:hypothetical protein n=1 Tax=Metabacillus litoralis TaxID=152268 RepID=UPI001CFD3272|nr:hypothetical protein [Metabacillus litoralis]
MDEKTTINLGNISVNTVGKECAISLSSSLRYRKHVVNKKTQGFGEQNADNVLILNPIVLVDDSDHHDSQTIKKSFI